MIVVFHFILSLLIIGILISCGKKKNKGDEVSTNTEGDKSEMPTNQESKWSEEMNKNGVKQKHNLPKAPVQGGMVASHDPNYHTLAAVGGDVFGTDKAAGPKRPAQGGMVASQDPNYQTLARVGGDCFGADKKAGGGGGAPKPPAAGVMVRMNDPNYQTLAGVGGDIFGADKKRAGGPRAPANPGAKAQVNDPNYHTLAGIGGNECFGADKKR